MINERINLMCEKAKEIQEKRGCRLWKEGDWYRVTLTNGINRIFVYSGPDEDEPYTMYNPIWLPSQEHLQLIVMNETGMNYYELLHSFILFVKKYFNDNKDNQSLDILWLKYAMARMHDKEWSDDAGDWV